MHFNYEFRLLVFRSLHSAESNTTFNVISRKLNRFTGVTLHVHVYASVVLTVAQCQRQSVTVTSRSSGETAGEIKLVLPKTFSFIYFYIVLYGNSVSPK